MHFFCYTPRSRLHYQDCYSCQSEHATFELIVCCAFHLSCNNLPHALFHVYTSFSHHQFIYGQEPITVINSWYGVTWMGLHSDNSL